MAKSRWLAVLLAFSTLAAGCSSTCKSGDLACILESMTWSDFGADGGDGIQGPLQTLTDVDVHTLETRAASAVDSGLVLIAVAPTVTFFEGGSTGALVGLEWTDPLGCRPAFCMSACPKGAQCLGARCSPPIRDGLGSATTLHWVTYDHAPDGSDFDLRVFAVSAPGCPVDVGAAITSGAAGLAISAPILIEMLITDQGATTTGTSGQSTTGSSGNCSGGFEASTVSCIPLTSDGSCSPCSGDADTCVTASQYEGTGFQSPGVCATQGTQGCLDGASGVLVKPCCVGLKCRVSSACGGGSVNGGQCLP